MAYIDSNLNDPSLFFNTVIFTGDGTDDRAITVGFQPNLSWVRQRTDASGGYITDSVRGNNAALQTTNTNAEGTFASMTFTSTGITVSGNENLNNEDAHNYVGWFWKESATAGFDIVTYTGNGSNRTISHSLSAPKVVNIKRRNTAAQWTMYHVGKGNTHGMYLNDTTAGVDAVGFFNDTDPTSSVFSVGTDAATNGSSDTYVSYLWSEKQGFSRFSKFVGSGSADGPFIWTGFRPALLIIKRTDTTDGWLLVDNKRAGYNGGNNVLEINDTAAEDTSVSDRVDLLSNGFKLRNSWSKINASGGTYIFMAFSSAPFTNSKGVPCNAR